MEANTFKSREDLVIESMKKTYQKLNDIQNESNTHDKRITLFGINIDAQEQTRRFISKGGRPDVTLF